MQWKCNVSVTQREESNCYNQIILNLISTAQGQKTETNVQKQFNS